MHSKKDSNWLAAPKTPLCDVTLQNYAGRIINHCLKGENMRALYNKAEASHASYLLSVPQPLPFKPVPTELESHP